MDEEKAREILGESIRDNNALSCVGDGFHYISYIDWFDSSPDSSKQQVELEGSYSIDTLEAIVWWIKNKTIIE